MSFNGSNNLSLPNSSTDQTPRAATSGTFAFPTSAPGPIGATTPDTGDFTTLTCSTITSSGAATIGGNTGITGTLSASSDFAVNTNKFNVTASSGNTTVAGTLGVTGATTLSSTLAVTGNVAVNTDKFTVAASSGNTVIAGTADITGNVAVNTNKFTVAASSGNTVVAGTLGVTGAATLSSTLAITGATTPTGGIAAAGGFSVSPRLCHTGRVTPMVATPGTDTTPVATETYIAEVYIDANCTVTGIAIMNGSAVAGNMKVGLADSTGAVVAETASTAVSGTEAYQRVAFTSPYSAKGPATYFVLLQNNNTSNRFRSHTVGNFGASKKTGESYGTLTTVTAPSTFTTNLAPIASLY